MSGLKKNQWHKPSLRTLSPDDVASIRANVFRAERAGLDELVARLDHYQFNKDAAETKSRKFAAR
jgi:hypothetical protein